VVKVSSEYKEIAEYIREYAKKENISVDEAVEHIMPYLFASYKRKDRGENNG
jgi:hypothetical protein